MSGPARKVCVMLIVFGAVLTAQAQDHGPLPEHQQALLDQLRGAIAAAEAYDSFVATASGATSTDQMLAIDDADTTSTHTVHLNRVTSFTHDDRGAANAQTVFEVEVSVQGFGELRPVTTTVRAEIRLVDGALYIRAEGQSSDAAQPLRLPEGWVQLTRADEWPALSVLSLDRILDNPTDPDLFDPTFYAMLDHASEVWSDAPEGGGPRLIGVRVAGDDFVAALVAITQADAALDEARAALVVAVTDGMWTLTAELDETGRIRRLRTESFMFWQDYDLASLQPTAPPGALFNQSYFSESEVTLSEVNVPREPIAAPRLE